MKICMTGHVYPLPPSGYAGVERVVTWWVESLRRRGHHVTLVANRESKLAVDRLIVKSAAVDAFVDGIRQAADCDVVHDNNDCHAPHADRWARPYCYTVHATVWNGNPNPVFLSYNQRNWFARRMGKDLSGCPVNQNGLPLDKHPVQVPKEDFVLWCASVRACKAPEMAIQLALDTGIRLKIIGPIQEGQYQYIARQYRAMDGQIEYLGEVPDGTKLNWFRRAAAFLYTCGPEWMEGWNLTNMEALLSGTPVFGLVTPNNRICEEQYEHGVGGFHAYSYEELRDLLKDRAWKYTSPEAVRMNGVEWNVENTVTRYEAIYHRLVAGERWGDGSACAVGYGSHK